MFYNRIKNTKPFIIYNQKNIINKISQWHTLLPNVKPYYALKCNPDKNIIKLVNSYNINFDCASKNEIKQIITQNIDPSRIIFANPIKMINHIDYAYKNNVDLMTFDSYEELKKISYYHKNARLIIRIKVDDSKSILKFNSKFGVALNDCYKLLKYAHDLQLNVVGVSFHVGSRCSDNNVYYNALNATRQVYNMALSLDYKLGIIDIGGGFPGSNDIEFTNMAHTISRGINDHFKNIKINFIAEPGRYFVESAYILVAQVIGKKIIVENNQKKIIYYISEGIYGAFNNIITDHYKPEILTLSKKEKYLSTVFGPTCDSFDCIGQDILLPELEINDILYVKNMGAYTTSCATSFNGFKPAKVKYIIN